MDEKSYTFSLLETKQNCNRTFYFQTNGQYRQNIYKESKQQALYQPFNGLYRLELEDPQSNAFLMQDVRVRMRHVQSGKYLTLIKKETSAKTIEVEKEKQAELIQRAHLDSKVSSEKQEDDYKWQEFEEVTDIGVFGESEEEEEDEKTLEEIQKLNPDMKRCSFLLQSAKLENFHKINLIDQGQQRQALFQSKRKIKKAAYRANFNRRIKYSSKKRLNQRANNQIGYSF